MPSKPTYEPLSIRILADRTGAPLADGSWPVAGMQFGDRDTKSAPPRRAKLPTTSLTEWRTRGIVSVEGSRIVLRSGGPPENPWKIDAEKGIPHMFEHLDRVVFHAEGGDVVYEVVGNPDKWPDRKEPVEGDQADAGFGGEVRWYYDLKLIEAAG